MYVHEVRLFSFINVHTYPFVKLTSGEEHTKRSAKISREGSVTETRKRRDAHGIIFDPFQPEMINLR